MIWNADLIDGNGIILNESAYPFGEGQQGQGCSCVPVDFKVAESKKVVEDVGMKAGGWRKDKMKEKRLYHQIHVYKNPNIHKLGSAKTPPTIATCPQQNSLASRHLMSIARAMAWVSSVGGQVPFGTFTRIARWQQVNKSRNFRMKRSAIDCSPTKR